MKSITLYEEKHSFLNHLSPECKLFYLITALLIPAICGSKWAAVGCICVSILLLIVGKVIRKAVSVLLLSSFLILTILVIQGLFRSGNHTELFRIGAVVFYKEGIFFAVGIAVNLLNVVLSFCTLVLTTKPSDLMEYFMRKGFSPRLGYVFISIFQIIPQMTDTMSTITDAQRSRGMETEGRLITRIRAFLPLISPVVMSSLVNTKERAIALEVRGFNSRNKKTFLNERKATKTDYAFQIILVLLILISVIWRVKQWLG